MVFLFILYHWLNLLVKEFLFTLNPTQPIFMKSFFLTFLVLFSLHFTLYAQEISKGADFVNEKKFDLREIIGADETGYYTLQTAAQGFSVIFSISKFDRSLVPGKTVPLAPLFNKEELTVESVILSNGKLNLLSSNINKKLKKKILYHQTIDKNSLVLNNDIRQIAEVEFQSFFKGGNILIDKSSDNSRILISCFPPRNDAKPKTVDYLVFDQDMKLQWQKNVTFPKELEGLYYNTRHVTKSGSVVIAPSLLENTIPGYDFSVGANSGYKVLLINKEGIIEKFELNLDKFYGKKIQFKITANDELICTGMYRKDPKALNTSDGIFYFKIDPVSKKVTKTLKEFPIEFITKYLSKKREEDLAKKDDKGKDLGLYDFNITSLHIKKDGGCYYIAEQYEIDKDLQNTGVGDGNTTSSVTFYYRSIVVINFNKEGVLQWMEAIPKVQVSSDNVYLSYVPALYNDELYILFNDHSENQQLWQTGKLKNFTSKDAGCVTLVKLDKTGKQERKVLDKTKAPIFIVPFYKKQLSDKELIFYNGKDDKKWFSSLRFK